MVTHVHDSHAFILGPEHKKLWGATTLVEVRAIEGKPVITKIYDFSAAQAGIHVGDVILTVDGEDAGTRLSRLGRYIASSTPQALRRDEAARLLDGPDQSTAVLVVEREGGQRAEAKLERSSKFWTKKRHYREGDVVQILASGIGYVDLDRLGSEEVNSMFEKLKNTAVIIIFDMRGYPNGDTAWQIAPRLTDRTSPEALNGYFPIRLEPDLNGTGGNGHVPPHQAEAATGRGIPLQGTNSDVN